jgi:hypothetical protein
MEKEFRAWYKGDNPPLLFEMVLKENEEIYFINKEHDIKYDFMVPFVDSDWIVEQYIQKRDKYNIKIFEGDKITSKYEDGESMTGIVVYRDCGYWLVDKSINYCCWLDSASLFDLEIVGNIHTKEGES